MRILIGVYELENFFGGTQTWTMTMRDALVCLGHDVALFAMSERVSPYFGSLEVLTPTTIRRADGFELVVCNSNAVLEQLSGLDGVVVFLSHGVLPELEQPIPGADLYLAVSEEVAWNVERQGYACTGILRNPIDTSRFNYVGCGERPKHICFVCRRHISPLEEELRARGYVVSHVGMPPVPDIRPGISDADVVVGLGRSAYEAMAQGKNVIVSGNNSGRSNIEIADGLITSESFFEFRTANCSGRTRMRAVLAAADLEHELERYCMEQGERNHQLILENNDSLLIARELLTFTEHCA